MVAIRRERSARNDINTEIRKIRNFVCPPLRVKARSVFSVISDVVVAHFPAGKANAMMLSSATGAPKKPPPVEVMTTY